MSYFSPALNQTPPSTANNGVGSPVINGDVPDMVITCSDPKTVWGIVGGAPVWHSQYTEYVRGIFHYQGLVFYVVGSKILAVNPKTGFVWKHFNLPRHAVCIFIQDNQNGPLLTVGYDTSGPGTVEMFTINFQNGTLTPSHTVAIPVSHPRSVYQYGNWLFISDTFYQGNGYVGRAIVCKINDNSLYNETPAHYCNDFQPIDGPGGEYLICAEHENRLYRWKYWNPTEKEIVLSAPLSPFNDASIGTEQIVSSTSSTSATKPSFSPEYNPPKQNVAQEYHTDISVYSPNAAKMYDNGNRMIIASTDDDVVLVLGKENGEWVKKGSVTGLNNPVNFAKF